MKKVVISILILLPFVLIVVISFAGRIFGEYDYIEVQGVSFLDENGDVTNGNPDYVLVLNVDEPVKLNYQVFPSNASNKGVTFAVIDTTVATVSQDGYITGLTPDATTRVRITTYNNITSEITVQVIDESVQSVSLDQHSLKGFVGGSATLNAYVFPSSAINKEVVWTTSNSQVCTVANGVVRFVGAGQAVITVTTVDGGFFDTCTVTVTSDGLTFTQDSLTVTEPTIDLSDYISGEMTDNAHFVVMSGDATINGTILTIANQGVVRVKLYVGDNPDINFFTMDIIYIRR